MSFTKYVLVDEEEYSRISKKYHDYDTPHSSAKMKHVAMLEKMIQDENAKKPDTERSELVNKGISELLTLNKEMKSAAAPAATVPPPPLAQPAATAQDGDGETPKNQPLLPPMVPTKYPAQGVATRGAGKRKRAAPTSSAAAAKKQKAAPPSTSESGVSALVRQYATTKKQSGMAQKIIDFLAKDDRVKIDEDTGTYYVNGVRQPDDLVSVALTMAAPKTTKRSMYMLKDSTTVFKGLSGIDFPSYLITNPHVQTAFQKQQQTPRPVRRAAAAASAAATAPTTKTKTRGASVRLRDWSSDEEDDEDEDDDDDDDDDEDYSPDEDDDEYYSGSSE